MCPHPARARNPAYVQFGRAECVTVEEETPLAFVYRCELQQLEPQWKYLCIIPDQGWLFPGNAVVKPAEAPIGRASPFKLAPSTDHFHDHPDLWR
ncbi:hypothetical protein VZT92_009076 [Zoarces viviparus]|uniref:Uncharacterized protein n=1 Tax=Zoarces viviparus TaxID=48416 RepID=A0AAW1FGS0_ZOAVI